ncbi:ribonuclease H2, subunit B [Thermoascus aurantiacus ATCC 26904]
MRTRSTTTTASPPETETEQQPVKTLTPAERPSKTFILPSNASNDARFVVLPNPSTGSPNRYFFCPKLGLYEFTAVSSPDTPRSILFAPTPKADDGTTAQEDRPAEPPNGAITKKAELLVATPVDILFFLIPLLSSPPSSSSSSKANSSAEKLFRPLDDILDSQDELPRHLRYVLYHDSFRPVLERRMEAICDTVEAGDEKMFRLSKEKLLRELLAKAERAVAQGGGLPASLEERFVRQALEMPLLSVKREDVVTADNNNNKDDTDKTNGENNGDAGSSAEKSEETKSSSAAMTSITPSGGSTPAKQSSSITTTTSESPSTDNHNNNNNNSENNEISHLQRIRIALSFIQSSYLPPHIFSIIDEMLDSSQIIDFKPLTEHLKRLADLRAEALASRTLADFSRKRAVNDGDELSVGESRAEKKRREEEEKRKKRAGESRGVRELRKVDTSGMKKMSDFFGKAVAKKKT